VMPAWTREFCPSMAGRHDEVLAQHKQTAELDANFFYFDSFTGLAYREKKMWTEAVAEYQRYHEVTGLPLAGLAVTYARMRRAGDAHKILQGFLDKASRQYVSPEQVAIIYAGLGETESAFQWLELRRSPGGSAFSGAGTEDGAGEGERSSHWDSRCRRAHRGDAVHSRDRRG